MSKSTEYLPATTESKDLTHGDLSRLTVSELKSAFFQSLEVTVSHFQRLAEIWRELQNRGEDMSPYREGIAIYIELIAHGRLRADFVVRYAGQKTLLNAISLLPVDQQDQVLQSESVELVEPESQGGFKVTEIKLSELPSRLIQQVFSETGLRSPDEQKKLLIRREGRPRPKASLRKARKVKIDQESQVLIAGGLAVDLPKVLTVLGDYLDADLISLYEEKIGS